MIGKHVLVFEEGAWLSGFVSFETKYRGEKHSK
jgi:hypothetical protein